MASGGGFFSGLLIEVIAEEKGIRFITEENAHCYYEFSRENNEGRSQKS